MSASERQVMRLRTYDVSDRRYPERDGRYVNLVDLLEMFVFLADDPDGGLHQIRDALIKAAKP